MNPIYSILWYTWSNFSAKPWSMCCDTLISSWLFLDLQSFFKFSNRHQQCVLSQKCLWLMAGWGQTECIKLFYLEECTFCRKWPQVPLLVLSWTASFIRVAQSTIGSFRQWLEMFNSFQRHHDYPFCPGALSLDSYPSFMGKKKKAEKSFMQLIPLDPGLQGSPGSHTGFTVPCISLHLTPDTAGWKGHCCLLPFPSYSQKTSPCQLPSPGEKRLHQALRIFSLQFWWNMNVSGVTNICLALHLWTQ